MADDHRPPGGQVVLVGRDGEQVDSVRDVQERPRPAAAVLGAGSDRAIVDVPHRPPAHVEVVHHGVLQGPVVDRPPVPAVHEHRHPRRGALRQVQLRDLCRVGAIAVEGDRQRLASGPAAGPHAAGRRSDQRARRSPECGLDLRDPAAQPVQAAAGALRLAASAGWPARVSGGRAGHDRVQHELHPARDRLQDRAGMRAGVGPGDQLEALRRAGGWHVLGPERDAVPGDASSSKGVDGPAKSSRRRRPLVAVEAGWERGGGGSAGPASARRCRCRPPGRSGS